MNPAHTETIHWHPTRETLPDGPATVLIFGELALVDVEGARGPKVWLGYHQDDQWFTEQNDPLEDDMVTHWADLPTGPL